MRVDSSPSPNPRLEAFEKEVCLFCFACKHEAALESLQGRGNRLKSKGSSFLEKGELSSDQQKIIQESLKKIEDATRLLFSKMHESKKARFLKNHQEEFDSIKVLSDKALSSLDLDNPAYFELKAAEINQIWNTFIQKLERLNQEGDSFFKQLPSSERELFLDAEQMRLGLLMASEDEMQKFGKKNYFTNSIEEMLFGFKG